MTVKISYKMFMVFLVTTVCSVILMVASNRYFSLWSQEAHVRQELAEALVLLSGSLAEEYGRNQNWEFLSDYSKSWEFLIRTGQGDNVPEFFVVNDHAGLLFRARNTSTDFLEDSENSLDTKRSFSLFTPEKKLISGTNGEFDKMKKVQIEYNGATIGWLGVNYKEEFPRLDKEIIKKLSILFNTIGGLILLVSTVVVFIFSRHLLAPVQQLSGAMKALTDRNFGVRISVKRKDELGVLAMRFNTMAQQLQEYERNQQQWLSDISHELRTPLAVLTGELEALEDGILTLDKSSISSLREEAKSLRRIVEDLHFISLAESGAIPLERKDFKPLPVLSQVICFFENRLKKNGMSIDVRLESAAADLKIAGDPVRLKQVFSNLIENALRYADKPGTLRIHQHRTADRLVIRFEDSGPGVPEHALPNLFERLYRAEPSRSRKTGGSGLGMAICKTIIEGHHGGITAANSERGGFLIEILLPILSESKRSMQVS